MSADRPRPRWWLQPRIALPVLAVVVGLAAGLAPEVIDPRGGDQRLSTYSSRPAGARLLYDLADRLGWPVSRLRERAVPRDSTAVLLLLDPAVPPPATHAHEILEFVRGGGSLLYVYDEGQALTDSLRLRRGESGEASVLPTVAGEITEACAGEDNGALPMWPDGDMHLWGIEWRGPAPRDTVTFAITSWEDRDDVTRVAPAAAGFPYGKGRIVLVADPDLLRSDVMRVCRWSADVAAVRMLEYLTRGERRQLVFDEFHQGHGAHPGTFAAILLFLSRTDAGNVLAVLALAGIVLLLARAPRLVPPRDTGRIERRSPAEHVQALAQAYEQVGASRTAVLRMLQGLRRRTRRRGAPPLGSVDDAPAFLAWVTARAPASAADVALVEEALGKAIPARQLVHVGEAIRRIEAALTFIPKARPRIRPTVPS